MKAIYIYVAIFAPIIVGLLSLFAGKNSKWLAVLTTAINICIALVVLLSGEIAGSVLNLKAYILPSGIYFAASIFAFLIVLYSHKYISDEETRVSEYYSYILMTIGCAAGALFSSDYITLIMFWGALGALLYMLIGISNVDSSAAAKKTLIIVGGSDAFMILGAAIVWWLTRSISIGSSPILVDGLLPFAAFLCLCAGAFAKAGVMPLHTWITESAEVSFSSVMAFLPASLDKLLGIYLLTRICLDIFLITQNSAASIFLLAIGSFTIVSAVMGALVQHNLKKLLAFHAVSQVGYMVIGLGCANPVGIAGGLFHMLNHSIYKCCLFMAGGAVEKNTGTTELEELGGLSKVMPITFVSTLVAAFSISGIPPFNGFVSKWMIYQGIFELSKNDNLWIIWLSAAMFGSALTLASFIKLLHTVFLGQSSEKTSNIKEVSVFMWLPMVILAALCVLFGLFARSLPIKYFILPSIGVFQYQGAWNPIIAAILLFVGLIAGFMFYTLNNKNKISFKPLYIGGEQLEESAVKVKGTEFYNSIKDFGVLNNVYETSTKKTFDIYELGQIVLYPFTKLISILHNGITNTYIGWIMIGGIIVLLLLR